MDYRLIITILGMCLAGVSYLVYFRDIARGHTKPHAFSWFVWAVLEFISFGIILTSGGGAGAWINAFTGVLCSIVAFIGLLQHHRAYTKLDWWAFGLALVSIALWLLVHQPALAIILVTTADNLAFIPTFRKSYHFPHEETLFLYGVSAVKYVLSLFALSQYNFSTIFYQTVLIIMNCLFIGMVVVRRRQLVQAKR